MDLDVLPDYAALNPSELHLLFFNPPFVKPHCVVGLCRTCGLLDQELLPGFPGTAHPTPALGSLVSVHTDMTVRSDCVNRKITYV